MADALRRVDAAISGAGLSLVVLDEEGDPVMCTGNARKLLGKDIEGRLEAEIREFLAGSAAESTPAREAFLSRQPEEARAKFARILNLLDHPILDEQGRLMCLILRSPAGGSEN